MSILYNNLRNTIEFDPEKREHRMLFNDFMGGYNWGAMPYRFKVSDTPHTDLVSAIQSKMIAHYMSNEFGKKTA
jgi:hypothetical protein